MPILYKETVGVWTQNIKVPVILGHDNSWVLNCKEKSRISSSSYFLGDLKTSVVKYLQGLILLSNIDLLTIKRHRCNGLTGHHLFISVNLTKCYEIKYWDLLVSWSHINLIMVYFQNVDLIGLLWDRFANYRLVYCVFGLQKFHVSYETLVVNNAILVEFRAFLNRAVDFLWLYNLLERLLQPLWVNWCVYELLEVGFLSICTVIVSELNLVCDFGLLVGNDGLLLLILVFEQINTFH